MSPIKVGLVGFNGSIGSAILAALVAVHKEKKIKLVLLHRESTELSKIAKYVDADMEKRVLALSEEGREKDEVALKDLQVVISTVGHDGIASQRYLVEALADSPNLKTFIPSDFGANWTDQDLTAPAFKGIKEKREIDNKARGLGVPITSIRVVLFASYFVAYKALGTDVKGNSIQKFRKSLSSPIRLTTFDYLGYAIATLVSDESTLSSIINQTVQIYDIAITGQEIIDVLDRIHGTPPQITEFTEDQYQEEINGGPMGVLAGLKAKWGDNACGPFVEDDLIGGWKLKSFEQLAREVL
ncbi:hypothetical protein CI109_102685 [Kwoniella shandongensis]|uniref:NmrA-like domain-containing protein n=1 Tax=Kwoniella shandongensis TaxID=1734106 RepID=A0A5M6BNW0_9TREE|nr:uncharacterized protein CI109_007115 [Kwoniella shandongensis]KAA5524568.1 hypothetical protein CI109_007115 [Kwoniella shandongensis]